MQAEKNGCTCFDETTRKCPVHSNVEVAETNRCPFCGAKPSRFYSSSYSVFRCGTSGPDQNGEYETGTECDKICYRNAYLRCHDLLVRIVDGSTPMAFKRDGSNIPYELMEDIRKELEENG